jgi:ATP-dependent Clp protease ATP-binding subunit ClpA
MLKKVAQRLEEKGIELEIKEEALHQLAEAGYDPQYGARPLRRVIQEKVDDALANLLLEGRLRRRDKVVFDGIDQVRVIEAQEI